MGSFGDRLRREREMRGVSLDDIAEATKIGTRLLRALEDEHFELLPGGIFNKGFVRAYAKYLGLNEDELVADYLQAAGESAPDPRVIAEQNKLRIDRSDGDVDSSRMAGFPIIPVLILLVVIAAGAGGWHIYQDRMRERRARQDAQQSATSPPVVSPSPATATPGSPPPTTEQPASGLGEQSAVSNPAGSGATQPAAQPTVAINASAKPTGMPDGISAGKPADTGVTSAPAPGPAAAANSDAQPFEVIVTPKDKAWVSIKTDGKITVRGIIGPPDVKTIRANEQIVFWTGNAGAVDVTFNGQHVPLAGGLNEVAVLVITPKGVTAAKPPPATRTQ